MEAVLKTWPGKWVDGSTRNQPHEASLLTLAIEKAVAVLEWYPVWSFEEGVRQTVAWYYERHAAGNTKMRDYTRRQIELYTAAARAKGLAWSKAGPGHAIQK